MTTFHLISYVFDLKSAFDLSTTTPVNLVFFPLPYPVCLIFDCKTLVNVSRTFNK